MPTLPPTIPLRVSLPNSWRTLQNPIAVFEGYSRRYGHNYYLRLGGALPVLMTTDPEVVQQVLQRNHRNYHKSEIQAERLAAYLGKGLLTNDGDDWLRQRRLIQPGFHRDRLATLTRLMQEVVNAELADLPQQGFVDICPRMMEVAFHIMAHTLFSEGIPPGQLHQLSDSVTRLQEFIIKPIRMPFLLPWLRLSGEVKRHETLMHESFAALTQLIARRRQSGETPDDLLQMLLDARYEDNGQPMDERRLLEEVMVLLVAGHETSANALAWTLYLLAQHPEVLERLHTEIDEVLAFRSPNFDELRQLPYLTQVIEESLRLYPPAWITDRVAIHDDEAHGIPLPAGTLVAPYIYGLHHHPDYWDEPERFDPDRMAPQRKKERHAYVYLPFGGGPRLCIGYSFAMMEMQITLATLVQRYHFELAPHQHIVAKPLIALRPADGIRMRFTPRFAVS